MNETRTRSLTKSIVWRLIGLAILPPIILGVQRIVGDDIAKTAIWSSVVFHGIRLVMYYYHERIWARIKWGHSTAAAHVSL